MGDDGHCEVRKQSASVRRVWEARAGRTVTNARRAKKKGRRSASQNDVASGRRAPPEEQQGHVDTHFVGLSISCLISSMVCNGRKHR